jgi:hypothetical protein
LQSLREALRDFAGGWSNDLADGWASALNGVQPNSDAVRDDLTFDPAEPIFPSRRGHALALPEAMSKSGLRVGLVANHFVLNNLIITRCR